MVIESYRENNVTASIATASVPLERRGDNHYWLGLASLDDLKTNTLESAAGTLVSQYSGNNTVYCGTLLTNYVLHQLKINILSKI